MNPALAARMAVDSAAGANQTAAGQAAVQAAQQQIAAQQQLASNLATQGQQAIQGQQAQTALLGTAGQLQNAQNAGQIQNALGTQALNQQTAEANAQRGMQAQQINAGVAAQNAGLNLGAQQINSGVAAQNAAFGQQLAGGLLNGSGGAINAVATAMMAGGGVVPSGKAPAGAVNSPLYDYLDDLHGLKPKAEPSLGTPALAMNGPAPAPAEVPSSLSSPTLGIGTTPTAAQMASSGPTSSLVPKGLSTAGGALKSAGQSAQQSTLGAYDRAVGRPVYGALLAHGGEADPQGVVPGRAKVAGDSTKNDVVPTLLSPGEVVLPRSITQSPDAPEKARRFVEHLLRRSGRVGYGRVLAARAGAHP